MITVYLFPMIPRSLNCRQLWTALVIVLVWECYSSKKVVVVVHATSDAEIHSDDNKAAKCGVWLAPSTITGAGLGMYAGVDFVEGEEILATGDSIVSIVDFAQHRAAMNRSDDTFLWDEYTWNADGLHASDDGIVEATITSPGFGSAANSFLPIYNVEEWYPRKDTVGLHRSRDPGIGGFSPYYDRKSTAKYPIAAGQELFVSYGSEWFLTRSYFGPIPVDDEFDQAQKLIEKYKSLQNSIGIDRAAMVWDTFVKGTQFTESRVIGSFHHNDADEMNILLNDNITLEDLRKQQSTRPLEWLEKHGTCGDHLAALPSTLPQAGRGAFAVRDLPQGTIVAQLPMIHIADRVLLDMYNFVTIPNPDGVGTIRTPRLSAGRMGCQLLLNYCYGHKASTLLLCPYGPLTNFINHNKTLANVQLRWGRPESGNHMPSLLEQTIDSFKDDKTAKFAMELIATRNIEDGEEIFLDYGDDWEQAWNEHLQKWKPVDGSTRYKSAADLNADLKSPLPTTFEVLNHKADPLPPNAILKCDHAFASNEWREHYNNGTIDHYLEFHEPNYYLCDILRRDGTNGNYTYTVHLYKYPNKKDDEDEVDEDNEEATVTTTKLPTTNVILRNATRYALRFFDASYTEDTFLPNAFRHDIRIPDHLFPTVWRNKDEISL